MVDKRVVEPTLSLRQLIRDALELPDEIGLIVPFVISLIEFLISGFAKDVAKRINFLTIMFLWGLIVNLALVFNENFAIFHFSRYKLTSWSVCDYLILNIFLIKLGNLFADDPILVEWI